MTRCFSADGGIGLKLCAVTDDGVHCALEYNCVRWSSHDLPPQAGIGVYDRAPDGQATQVSGRRRRTWPVPGGSTALENDDVGVAREWTTAPADAALIAAGQFSA